VQVLKAKGHGLKLAIDTARTPLEPVIAAVMQHCHILDMTISDPPMEEIIAAIYGQGSQAEHVEGKANVSESAASFIAGESKHGSNR
jgi:ABC-2 type transport system ATP-binding protein